MIKVKRIHPEATIPTKANLQDAGYDLYAVEDIDIPPASRRLVRTGIAIQLPPNNIYARIAPRSGLALKHGIDVMAGVVDPGYTGEIGVVLLNTDQSQNFAVSKGDRIAQIILEVFTNDSFEWVDTLETTDRSQGGFGSTGR